MEEIQLKMNDGKTEFNVLGTSNNLRKNTWILLKLLKLEKQKFTKHPKLNFLEYIPDEQLNLKDTFRTEQKKPTTISCSFIISVNTLILTLTKCYSAPWY